VSLFSFVTEESAEAEYYESPGKLADELQLHHSESGLNFSLQPKAVFDFFMFELRKAI
jgi:hypothetical protein